MFKYLKSCLKLVQHIPPPGPAEFAFSITFYIFSYTILLNSGSLYNS